MSSKGLEGRIKGFAREQRIDLRDLTLEDVNQIRQEFGIGTRADVLALLKKNRKRRNILYEVYAADFYDATPWMHRDRAAYKDKDKLFCLLYNNLSKLDYRGLAFLILALKTGGKITSDDYSAWCSRANEANYAIKKEDLFLREVRRVYMRMPVRERRVPEKRVRANLLKRMDRKKFRRLDDPRKPVCEIYLKRSLWYAFMLYGNRLIRG